MKNELYYGRLDQRRINELNGVLRYLKGKLKKMNEALNPLYHLSFGKINEDGISVKLWKYDEVDSWIMDFVTGWWWSHLTQLPTASGLQRFCDEIWENIPAEYKERDWKQIQPPTHE